MSLGELLFTGYRRRVLGLLLLHPERRLHVREIARLTGTVAGTVNRELAKLAEAGLLTREKAGNQVRYGANTECPIYSELAAILRKTSGLVDVLVEALLPLAERIDLAFVFGSMASGKAGPHSDIDLLVIGTPGFTELVTRLYPAQQRLEREINPKLFTPEEWQRLRDEGGAFVTELINKPKLFIFGEANELG